MSAARPLAAGLAGALTLNALTLNALNEAAHRLAPPSPAVPRLDRLGTAALAQALGLRARPARQADRAGAVYAAALALDVAVNTATYATVAAARRPVLRGVATGALGGAVALGGAFLLGREEDVARRPATPWLTVAWYVAGGAAAGLVARALAERGG